jgi:hypothetical protein
MATRIESGQIQLRGVGGVPMTQVTPREVDYVGYRAEAQAANTLSQLVDRMSQTAFQMAGEAAKDRAMFDVATNPLSQQQLELAKNGDMSFMGRGSQFNIYDATLRKARAFELSSAFETEAKAEVVKIMADIESGQMNSETAAQKLNTVTNGFARSLANVDADAALKFTASMGVYSNTVMAEAYKKEQQRARERKTLMLESDFTNSMRLIEPAIEQGFYVDADGMEQPIDQLLDVYRKNLTDHAFSVGGLPLAKEYQGKFDKAVTEGRVNAATKVALGDEYMSDPVMGLQMLRSGNLGRMSGVFLAMPQDDKNKVVANFMTAVNQRETLAKEAQQAQEREAVTAFVPLYTQWLSLPEGSPQRRALTRQITTIAEANPKAIPLGVLSDLLKPQGDGNPTAEFNALAGIYSGQITTPDQIYALPGLNGRQRVSLLNKLMSEDRRNDSQLDREISRLAGIPVIPGQMVVLDPKATEWQQRQRLSGMADQYKAKMMAEGKPFTNQDVIDYLNREVEGRRNTEAARVARQRLETYSQKDWINGPITRDSIPTLRRKAGNSQVRQREVDQIEKLLNQAEGN